jgi:hypothetical protein
MKQAQLLPYIASRRLLTGFWKTPSEPTIMNMLLRVLCLLLPCAFVGCFATHLVHDLPLAETSRLVESSPQYLALEVHDPIRDSSHGYQFLLGILPISRIFAEDAKRVVISKLQLLAALAGTGLSEEPHHTRAASRLVVTIASIDIDGYDLIVFRRPSAQVTLTGTLYAPDSPPQTCTQVGAYSEVTRFAFSPELNRALEMAAFNAAQNLLACLGIASDVYQEFSSTIQLSENL